MASTGSQKLTHLMAKENSKKPYNNIPSRKLTRLKDLLLSKMTKVEVKEWEVVHG